MQLFRKFEFSLFEDQARSSKPKRHDLLDGSELLVITKKGVDQGNLGDARG